MANTYSDIIQIRGTKPAYNIQNEEKGEWDVFIANEQFNDVLKRVVKSVYNNDPDTHKSFWLEGTYGSGKSHAAAVIMHLLCDEVADIRDFLNSEYHEEKYGVLRNSVFNLREKKRLFPVKMYGQCSISHKDDLSLQIQRAVKMALQNAGIDIVVQTDFDNYISHIESSPQFWDNLIASNATLRSTCPDRKKLIADLQSNDTGTLSNIKDALRENRLDVRIDSEDLSKWFFEVQDKLAEKGVYDGLLIVWDEFTDLMLSAIGPSLLVELQKITEEGMNSKNNSYFFFISHPSALNSLKAEERTKTQGRYNYMHYNMEPVSAFKIMSRKFKVVGTQEEYENLYAEFFERNKNLLDTYAATSTNIEETRNDIKHLYPIHPSTANLATYYAREAGSSSRSVFEFLGNESVRDFLDDFDKFNEGETITADYLWDYVLDEFCSNTAKYGAVTERYNSYQTMVANQGEAYSRVFKGILLLNALNNIANSPLVTPNEDNIYNLFVGTSYESDVYNVLNWLNDQSVIQRAPGGLFSIQFSALPPKEIEDIKDTLHLSTYKFTSQVVNFDGTARGEFDKMVAQVARPYSFGFFSLDNNSHTLLSKIENEKKKAHPYELFFAVMLSRNIAELNELRDIAADASKEERFKAVIFLVMVDIFEDKNYERFIEYQANATCAQKHGFTDQQQSHIKNASELIKDWFRVIKRGTFNVYIDGDVEVFSCTKLVTSINNSIAPLIFSKGPEALELIRIKYSKTYWKKASVKDTVKNVLLYKTKEDITEQCKGPAMHMGYLLQDSVDDDLTFKVDVDKNHPLYQVSKFVSDKIKHADKSNEFNFCTMFDELRYPPYGLFQSYAGMGMLAFALKPYVGKIFDLNGKPREELHLVEDVTETFKAWEEGKISQKVNFKFQTEEEGELCKQLTKVFSLDAKNGEKGKGKEYSDISSLKDARWAISRVFLREKNYPLWSLKYAVGDGDPNKDDLLLLIDNIVKICHEADLKNPALIVDTLALLKELNYEMRGYINAQDNYFKIGFERFLLGVETVSMKKSEIEEAVRYLRSHLEEVGYWKENEVIDKLKDWKLKKQNVRKPTPDPDPWTDKPSLVSESQSEEDKQKAINKIQAMDEYTIKRFLKRLCDEEYGPYLIDRILKQ